MPTPTASLSAFLSAAASPPAQFGMMPFWFWNDDLDLRELLRQLHAFRDGGMGGIVIHPRTGLSRRVGYLTLEYFRLVRRVVEECARLGMKVILYDEGGYPSGSACGQVVAANPDHAAHALILAKADIVGPYHGYWRPNVGRSLQQRLVSVVLARAAGEGIDPTTLRLLEPDAHGLVCLDVASGAWRALACIDVPSGGTIRGVFPEHEDGMATAPPAGDILNPEAVASFLGLTHDAYARHLGAHLGATVVALFTDEPSALGRGARRGAQPYTPGFEEWLGDRLTGPSPHTSAAESAGASALLDDAAARPSPWGRGGTDVRAWLPALWVDYGPATLGFRRAYADAVHARIRRVF